MAGAVNKIYNKNFVSSGDLTCNLGCQQGKMQFLRYLPRTTTRLCACASLSLPVGPKGSLSEVEAAAYRDSSHTQFAR